MSAKRWSWVAAIAIGVVAVGWALRPAPLTVDVAAVDRGPLTVAIAEEGTTRVIERFVVATPVTGRLRRIELAAGDSVEAGTVVARLEPAPLDPRTRQELAARLEAALDAARMARAIAIQAKEALDQATRERNRIETLFRQNVIASEVRERSVLTESSRRRELEAADFQAQAATHEAEQARAAVASMPNGRAVVRSPIAGRVLRVLEPSERVVTAGTPLLEIGDPARLEVVADVLTTDAVRLTPGDTMAIVGWGGPDTLTAILDRVEPSGFTKVSALGVEEQRVNVVGRIQTPPAALGDRYRGEVRIAIWRTSNAVRVPRSALFRVGETWRVFVVGGGRARERVIRVGQQAEAVAEVLDGITTGDQVIVHPDERVSDGTRVTARTTGGR